MAHRYPTRHFPLWNQSSPILPISRPMVKQYRRSTHIISPRTCCGRLATERPGVKMEFEQWSIYHQGTYLYLAPSIHQFRNTAKMHLFFMISELELKSHFRNTSYVRSTLTRQSEVRLVDKSYPVFLVTVIASVGAQSAYAVSLAFLLKSYRPFPPNSPKNTF